MEVYGLHDFDGLTEDELSFKRGDKLKVLSYFHEDDWSKVIDQTGKIGLVPRWAIKMDVKDSWLFPCISRTNAVIYLKDKKAEIGSFVVRCSQTKDGYAISIKMSKDQIGHMYIDVDNKTGYVHLWKIKFNSLRALVNYYKTNEVYQDIRLIQPILPRLARSLYNFEAQSEWELSMKANNIISILTYVNRNWYLAVDRSQNRVGIVPRNYIELCMPENCNLLNPLKSPGFSQLAKRRIYRRDSTGLNNTNKKTKTDLITFDDDFCESKF
jgi:hypothetical protein